MRHSTLLRVWAPSALVCLLVTWLGGAAGAPSRAEPSQEATRPSSAQPPPAGQQAEAVEPLLRVVVTIRPLELLTLELIGPSERPYISVTCLVPPEVNPHEYAPTPEAITALRNAHIVVCNGRGVDDWVAEHFKDEVNTVRLADLMMADERPEATHLWLDPLLVRKFSMRITQRMNYRLKRTEGGMPIAGALKRPYGVVSRQADAYDRQLGRLVAPHAGRPVVCLHGALDALLSHYGVEVIALQPDGVSEPTMVQISNAMAAISSKKLKAVFAEAPIDPGPARQLAEQTGLALLSIDPIGAEAESWTSLMGQIVVQLEQGLGQKSD